MKPTGAIVAGSWVLLNFLLLVFAFIALLGSLGKELAVVNEVATNVWLGGIIFTSINLLVSAFIYGFVDDGR